jgi:flagellar protein FliL
VVRNEFGLARLALISSRFLRLPDCNEWVIAMAEGSISASRVGRTTGGNSWVAGGIALAVALTLGIWFWHRSATVEATEAEAANSDVKGLLHLDSFVTNLNSTSGNGYLRVGIDLGLGVELKDSPAQATNVSRVRDIILGVLATRSVEELLTPEGKAKLKDDLLNAIREHAPEIHCHEVYFTEFLVQH